MAKASVYLVIGLAVFTNCGPVSSTLGGTGDGHPNGGNVAQSSGGTSSSGGTRAEGGIVAEGGAAAGGHPATGGVGSGGASASGGANALGGGSTGGAASGGAKANCQKFAWSSAPTVVGFRRLLKGDHSGIFAGDANTSLSVGVLNTLTAPITLTQPAGECPSPSKVCSVLSPGNKTLWPTSGTIEVKALTQGYLKVELSNVRYEEVDRMTKKWVPNGTCFDIGLLQLETNLR